MTPTILISGEEIEGQTIILAEQIELIEDPVQYAEAAKEQYLKEIKNSI